jgi:hypothetical protein
MSYPPKIEHFHAVLSSLPSVIDVSSGIESLQGVSAEDLRLPDFAAWPIGALRRTNGGLEAEALIQFELRLTPDANAWRTIEFLAWFVRDQSRGGVAVQLRPFALSPEVAGQVQHGHTLCWHIDLFCDGIGSDLSPVLEQVETLARTLEIAMKVYATALAGEA